jgi:hypothetical protein
LYTAHLKIVDINFSLLKVKHGKGYYACFNRRKQKRPGVRD